MRLPITATWGKLQRQHPEEPGSPISAWHPLIDHCVDVAACVLVLLGLRSDGSTEPTIVNRRLARLAGTDHLDAVTVLRLGVLAALHDIGKFNHGFQAKATEERGKWRGHVGEALSLLLTNPQHRCLAGLDLDRLATWAPGEQAMELLVAAISHHGRPAEAKLLQRTELALLWDAQSGYDPTIAMSGLGQALRRWLPQAWEQHSPLSATPAFQHAFCGLVQLADWIGSDTEFFPFSGEGDGDRWPIAMRQAHAAMRAIGFDTSDAKRVLPACPEFARISAFQPRPMQAAVGAIPPVRAGSLVCIEEETGGGKTEAALWHFVRLFAAGAVDGLYFALPTRTAATQIYERIRNACARCFPDPATRPPVILAVPGYLGADGAEGRRMAPFEVLWNDDPDRANRHRRWAAETPKRYLAGAIAVGTIDQALLATLAVDHAHLRSTCLLRSLLVVDEVHASDPYMTRLLAELLTRMRAADGHVLLMSATLGAVARDQLLRAWGAPATTTSAATATGVPYPTLLVAGSLPQAIAHAGRDRQIGLSTAPADDSTLIARQAITAAQVGARVLIIRNTVRDCLAVQNALEASAPPELLWRVASPQGPVPAPHHARFARDDRRHLDQELESVFGKNAARQGGRIVCATQTVQQALDLDADWMLTDLAPVDVLLQRLGRLHRHQRPRPAGFEGPRACVLMPNDGLAGWLDQPKTGPHGWGTVYSDLRVLEATRRLVMEGSWSIPHDNRRLVEAATHPEILAGLDPAEPRWASHGASMTGSVLAQRDRARLGLLPWMASFGDQAVCFPSGDLAGDIRTRLGEDDRLMPLDDPIISPFGTRIDSLTLPGRWCHDIPADAIPTVRCNAGCAQIGWGGLIYTYDRLGLRRERNHGQS